MLVPQPTQTSLSETSADGQINYATSACGGGGSSSSSPSSVLVSQSLKSVELSIPEGFDFSTEREVVVSVHVASSQSSRGFMSIYTDFR